jgi:hypothetical protein
VKDINRQAVRQVEPTPPASIGNLAAAAESEFGEAVEAMVVKLPDQQQLHADPEPQPMSNKKRFASAPRM